MNTKELMERLEKNIPSSSIEEEKWRKEMQKYNKKYSEDLCQ
jgi:menaquinone-dependent protoporphyrinogen IX oxidase